LFFLKLNYQRKRKKKAHADETQAPLIELIKQGMNEGVVKRYTPFFVANCIIVEAKIAFVELIAKV